MIVEYLGPETLNAQDSRVLFIQLGLTPLAYSVLSGKTEVTLYLLKQGADPNIPNSNWETPLHYASDNSQFTIAKLLLECKANCNVQNKEGETPLHNAAYRGDLKMVKLLLSYGASVSIQNASLQRSPLHYAVMYGNIECIHALLRTKASFTAVDSDGKVPFDYITPGLDDMLRKFSSFDDTILSVVHEDEWEASLSSVDFEAKASVRHAIESNEPECEHSSLKGGNLHLFNFLCVLQLEEYFGVLVDSGFDDLEILMNQMRTPVPLTEATLREIGMTKPGHMRRILMKLSGEENAISSSELDLYQWLESLSIESSYENFILSGYDNLDFLFKHMDSEYPITDSVLREIGISKKGHRMRLLGALLTAPSHSCKPQQRSCCITCKIF